MPQPRGCKESDTTEQLNNNTHLLICVSSSAYKFTCEKDVCLILTFHYALCVCVLSHFSHVQLYATVWKVACQALPSMGFSRQGY